MILTWSFPSLTTSGQALREVRAVRIHRYVEPLPAAAGSDPNVPDDPAVPQPVRLFARVPPPTPAQFAKLSNELARLTAAELAGATAGSKLIYEDTPPFHSSDGRPVRVTYVVVTEGRSARSEPSNLATIVPVDVPAPPAGLTATPRAEGVALAWQEPQRSAGSEAKPFIVGYNIYRSAANAPAEDLDIPVNTSPAKDPNYLDTPPFGVHRYRVTAIVSTSPRIESEPSEPVTATFRDLMPPPAPARIAALVETRAVRLIWDAVEAADLAGYRIYRTEGIGHGDDIRVAGTFPIVPGPHTSTTWTDTSPDLGIAFRYGVASLDRSGNESQPVWTEWVVVPKTP